MMIGFYALIRKGNLIKKVIGAGVFQTAVFLFYLSIGKVIDPAHPHEATAPILFGEGGPPPHLQGVPFENPVPHVLMLTGIVVGVATTAVALALIVRIQRAFGTIEEDELLGMER
jgi:multicomponent Na+:H+ antiporter subunit C